MPLQTVSITDFRCIASAELAFSNRNNLITGPNGSGKTSLLEAIAYLGRGRSFRGAGTRELVRHGTGSLVVVGKVDVGARCITLGIRNGPDGLEIHAEGDKSASAAPLAEALPLQVIDPEIHELIGGGPEGRRRYLDWIAFHVEHGYLETWRRFRRALRQRNAALKAGTGLAALRAWDDEFCELGGAVDKTRRAMVGRVGESVVRYGEALLGGGVDMAYSGGWPAGRMLADVLVEGVDRDRQLGATQAGPHRADLRMAFNTRQARKRVSRGQQKLLACAMILAATETVQAALEKPLLLLLDDPSAELDVDSVARLMAAVEGLGSQVIATSLEPDRALFREPPRLFHVEHGRVETAR